MLHVCLLSDTFQCCRNVEKKKQKCLLGTVQFEGSYCSVVNTILFRLGCYCCVLLCLVITMREVY